MSFIGTFFRYASKGRVLVALLLLVGCGVSADPHRSSYDDPSGDAFGTGPGVNYDITRVVAETTSDMLTLHIRFAQEVALPEPGESAVEGEVAGFVVIDADRDPATGGRAGDNPALVAADAVALCPASEALGIEVIVELFDRDAQGSYPVFDTTFAEVGRATPSLTGDTLTLALPLTSLAGSRRTQMVFALGNGLELTDCAPDSEGAFTTTARPVD